jgi:hypothetical protein
MDYCKKYLKYKNKYLDLKNKLNGNGDPNMPTPKPNTGTVQINKDKNTIIFSDIPEKEFEISLIIEKYVNKKHRINSTDYVIRLKNSSSNVRLEGDLIQKSNNKIKIQIYYDTISRQIYNGNYIFEKINDEWKINSIKRI